jgi:MFS family permease
MGNEKRLLWAGFTAILAAGMGFAIRGGILDNWGREFGFTGAQLGNLGGAGFTGFCFGIIIGGVIADRVGYGKLVIAAFLLHVVSAFVTFTAHKGMSTPAAYAFIYWGTFIFALANGTLEAVANPLVATLFPAQRTHYLNVLHASWPLGLVLGSALCWLLDDKLEWSWKLQLGLFLLPTAAYGLMFFRQPMPKSEASAKGLRLADMFKDVGMLGGLVVCFLLAMFFGGAIFSNFMSENVAAGLGYAVGGALLILVGVLTKFSMGSFLLFALFVAHLLVGAVELGTDGWIQNITGTIFSSEAGKFLFVFTSLVMFGLRFCSHFIEKRLGLSPVGILLACGVLACLGLLLTSAVTSLLMAVLALTVYAVGKTFFWPTMLAVASDRFPRTGAVAISIMGGIGTMSAGLIGMAGLGYARDRFAGEDLRAKHPAVYERVKAEKPSAFLVFDAVHGFDGKKLGAAEEALKNARKEADARLALETLSPDDRAIIDSNIAGSRKTLVADAAIPALMALIYLGILAYFKSIGGYKAVTIESG